GQPPTSPWHEERPEPQPPRKRVTPALLVGVAGVVVIVVALCCIGGFLALRDSDPDPSESSAEPSSSTTSSSTTSSRSTSTTTSSSTTSPSGSPSDEATSTSPPTEGDQAPSVTFPDSFSGWTKSDSDSETLAIYRKGKGEALSVVAIPRDQVDSFYDRVWED